MRKRSVVCRDGDSRFHLIHKAIFGFLLSKDVLTFCASVLCCEGKAYLFFVCDHAFNMAPDKAEYAMKHLIGNDYKNQNDLEKVEFEHKNPQKCGNDRAFVVEIVRDRKRYLTNVCN